MFDLVKCLPEMFWKLLSLKISIAKIPSSLMRRSSSCSRIILLYNLYSLLVTKQKNKDDADRPGGASELNCDLVLI